MLGVGKVLVIEHDDQVKQQTFLEGKAPSQPPGGYVKLRGPEVNTDVPDDCKLTIYDATYRSKGDSCAIVPGRKILNGGRLCGSRLP